MGLFQGGGFVIRSFPSSFNFFRMATTLVAARKRGFSDAFGSASPQCSPHKIAFLDLGEARRAKRTLMMMEGNKVRAASSPAQKVARGLANAHVSSIAPTRSGQTESSAFAGACPPAGELNLPAGDKVKMCKVCKQRATGERLYSGDEVRDIVQKALAQREQEIEATYNQVLHDRLEEQFNDFRRYHEDCVSRQLNHSDYSYMS